MSWELRGGEGGAKECFTAKDVHGTLGREPTAAWVRAVEPPGCRKGSIMGLSRQRGLWEATVAV